MTERLPRQYYDLLAEGICEVGHLALHEVISSVPAPAHVRREMHVEEEQLYVIPEAYISDDSEDFYFKRPRHIGISLLDYEKFQPNPRLTVYYAKTLILDTKLRSRHYELSVSLQDETGGLIVSPQLHKPAPSQHFRPGTKEWRAIKERSIEPFGVDEAEHFIATMRIAADRIRQQKD